MTQYAGVFRDLVRGGMERKGFSLRELCRRSSLDPSLMSKVFAGKRNPPLDDAAIEGIADALELDCAALFVSVGRLPDAWRGLAQDGELFKKVDDLVCGRLRPAPRVKAASRSAAGTSKPPRRQLPDELL
ncbi:MAG: helix-turn-helix transcriptional regulator [Elusimicrobiales bacterium]|nr:helix-turn-helix transcriptional regulator [Elusimicrobiales bacterium]